MALSYINVVIFAGGKYPENVSKTFHVGVILMIHLLFSEPGRMSWELMS